MLKFVACSIFLALGTVTGTAALAQVPTNNNLASLGGTMHAVAEACGGYSAAQLAQMKEQQRQAAAQTGMSSAEFDRSFNAGYSDGKAKVSKAAPAQKETMCRDVRVMGGK